MSDETAELDLRDALVEVGPKDRETAIKLLAAADELGLDQTLVVRTTTHAYIVPKAVLDKAFPRTGVIEDDDTGSLSADVTVENFPVPTPELTPQQKAAATKAANKAKAEAAAAKVEAESPKSDDSTPEVEAGTPEATPVADDSNDK